MTSGTARLRPPTRATVFGAIALIPVLLAVASVEVTASIADSLDGIHSHRTASMLWLAVFALLGVCGPVVAAVAARQTRADGGRGWQIVLRSEMAFALIGMPASLLLLML